MGRLKFLSKKGFTIIEVVLVVGISSALMVALMVGWNINIQRQRYEDAVNTLKSDIEQLYDDVRNTKNDANPGRCTEGAKTVSLVNDANSTAGVSNCIIMGKIIAFSNSAADFSGGPVAQKDISVWNLVGLDKDYSSYSDSISAILGAKLTVDPRNQTKLFTQWSTNMLMATDNRKDIFRDPAFTSTAGFNPGLASWTALPGMAIIKSPLDGTILSFGMPRVMHGHVGTDSAQNKISTGHLLDTNKTFNICLRPDNGTNWGNVGGIFGGRNKVLRISGGASPVQIAPLDGDNSMYCTGRTGFGAIFVNGRSLANV